MSDELDTIVGATTPTVSEIASVGIVKPNVLGAEEIDVSEETPDVSGAADVGPPTIKGASTGS